MHSAVSKDKEKRNEGRFKRSNTGATQNENDALVSSTKTLLFLAADGVTLRQIEQNHSPANACDYFDAFSSPKAHIEAKWRPFQEKQHRSNTEQRMINR